jgi:methionyl-tRNA synthetase
LPYANAGIHIGHLVEYLYADIWVRYLRLRGEDAIYICADDTHGTPIQVRAMKEGVAPEEIVRRFHAEHTRDFADFGVQFDMYYSTHSEENRRWSERIFQAAKDKGVIARRSVEQMYCPKDQMFLPDRFVRGVCPKCGAKDQYGDVCEVCSSTYPATELKDPGCAICGTPPIRKSSEHLFFELGKLTDRLREWTNSGDHLQSEVKNYVNHWIEGGLRDWDISRDGPYFGFPIPGEQNKFFYVWLDAPIGYIASTEAWCKAHGRDVADYWERPGTEIYHVIGKDILYFHTLFWPAMLMAADLNLPTQVIVHGFLRVGGEKMSKSRGTFINARTYLDHLDPQFLRYYYAAKLSGKLEDLDFVFEDFVNRVNAELVNKIANLASRSISFVHKKLGGKLGRNPDDARTLLADVEKEEAAIADAYARRNLAEVVERICRLAEAGNLYLQHAAPWEALGKGDPERARDICTAAINATKILTVYLKPILPQYAADVEAVLNLAPLTWADAKADLAPGHAIGEFKHLVQRVERAQVDAIVEASKVAAPAPPQDYTVDPLAAEINLDAFARLDLRVAEVVAATAVEGAKKIVQLTLDLGPLGRRTVYAGIAEHVSDPHTLVGKKMICVANLAPRKMKFGVSEGMILASLSASRGDQRQHLALLEAPEGKPGERIH